MMVSMAVPIGPSVCKPSVMLRNPTPREASSSTIVQRDTMIERTRAGLAAAAANGRKGGRPRKVDDADAAKARHLREKGITATDIAKMLGVSRATVYRYLSEDASLPV